MFGGCLHVGDSLCLSLSRLCSRVVGDKGIAVTDLVVCFCVFVAALFFFAANFVAGEYGATNWSESLEHKYDVFCETLLKVNADFQMDPSKNYEKDLPGQANPAICGAQITQRYGCLRRRWSNLLKTRRRNFQTRRRGGVRNEVCCWGRRCWTVLVRCCERSGGREGVVCVHVIQQVSSTHMEWRVYGTLV